MRRCQRLGSASDRSTSIKVEDRDVNFGEYIGIYLPYTSHLNNIKTIGFSAKNCEFWYLLGSAFSEPCEWIATPLQKKVDGFLVTLRKIELGKITISSNNAVFHFWVVTTYIHIYIYHYPYTSIIIYNHLCLYYSFEYSFTHIQTVIIFIPLQSFTYINI